MNITSFSAGEQNYCETIRAKDRALREFLNRSRLACEVEPHQWLDHLVGIKNIIGNLSNDIGFVATLLVKHYLERRFAILNFDASAKAQGAPGIDIEATCADGKTVAGELKTTKPYQPGFGAAQRTSMLKDLARLASVTADHRFLFVVNAEAFDALCKKTFASKAPGVEIVDLVTGKTYLCPANS